MSLFKNQPENFGELFVVASLLPKVQDVAKITFEFFVAPAAFIFFAALLEIVKSVVPKEGTVGDATRTVFFLNVAVTLHFEVGEEVI